MTSNSDNRRFGARIHLLKLMCGLIRYGRRTPV